MPVYLFLLKDGCGYYCDIDVCSYEIINDTEWLPNTLTEAIKFWASKGVYLDDVKDDGNIKVDIRSIKEPEDINGYYLSSTIFLDKERLDLNYNDLTDMALDLRRKCVLAHEMGHSFGMKHVEGEHGLMTERNSIIYTETDCPWSDSDQEELERIISGGKKRLLKKLKKRYLFVMVDETEARSIVPFSIVSSSVSRRNDKYNKK